MFRGVFSGSAGPAGSYPAGRRLCQLEGWRDGGGQGPLAVGQGAALASAAGVSCHFSGRLYEPSRLADELGLPAGSDAELLLQGYRRLGEELLPRLRGRFAFALWDEGRGSGLLATDPLASQPLFLWRGSGGLAFAAEPVELLPLLPTAPGPDPVGFPSWLGGWTLPIDCTLYEGVSRLPPGHLVRLGEDLRPVAFWQPRYRPPLGDSRAELAAGLRKRLETAVARRASPESSGVVLSGGLDSSVVTALASEVKPAGADLRTYSAVFPGELYDEGWKVESLVSGLGFEPDTFTLAPQGSLWLNLSHLKRWGLPLMGSAALIDIAMVTAAAADGVAAVLDGQTGDEVFGCSPWVVADHLAAGRLPTALGLARNWPGYATNRRERRHILKHWGLKGAAPYALHGHRRRHSDPAGLAPSWLLPQARQSFLELRDEWAWKRSGSGPRWWRYLSDLLVEAPHRELRLDYLRNRAASAGVSGETPLYDVDLIEYTLSLPPELAFDVDYSRPLVREAVRDIVPDDVRLQREKANFSPFSFAMLTGADADGIDHLLSAPDAELGAYADLGRVRDLWLRGRPAADGRGGTTGWGTEVWRLAAAESWLRSLADPGFPDEMLARPDVLAPALARAGGDRSHLALF